MRADLVLQQACVATMTGDGLGLIDDGVVAIRDGEIVWVGARHDAPQFEATETQNLDGALVMPGLIDCHTHIVFAGNRANEFERRLHGASYAEIAKAGGGILSTVRSTREASEDALFLQSRKRVETLMREGVTTIEIKSGYGLDLATEEKMLRVAQHIGETLPISVQKTFLGAHALPPEFTENADGYIDQVCNVMLPHLVRAGLVDAVDAFCEGIGFSVAQTWRVFESARQFGVSTKLHAEQLSDLQGAALAASFGALSADHLEYASEAGVMAMAGTGTVAVMLPAAFYFLRETRVPPITLFRQHNVPMAVASDVNPGSSPVVSLLAAMHMAATLFRMTPMEILRGVTVNAARALGLQDRGVIRAGARADLCVWDVETPAELCYWLGGVRPSQVIFNGKQRHD